MNTPSSVSARLDSRPKCGRALSALLLAALAALGGASAARADEYDALRLKWVELMAGNASNPADADIAAQTIIMTATAQNHWNNLNKSAGRTYLWSDLATQYPNQNITGSYERLRDMARAYATPGSSLHGNTSLVADVIAGLDWLNANWYNTSTAYGTQSADNNWFAWEIGAPWALEDAMAMVYTGLTPAQIASYANAITYWCVTPEHIGTSMNSRWGNTGANRAWKSLVWAQLGILSKNSATLSEARRALSPNFAYTQSGDGFHADGSFIQHGSFAYTSGYGFGQLGATIDLMYLLNGSTWAITDPSRGNVRNWIYDAFEPNIFRNRIYDHLNGRTITRGPAADGANSMLMMSWKLGQLSAPSDTARLKSFIKYLVLSDPTFDWTKFGPFSVQSLKSVVNSGSVTARSELTQFKMFPQMDRFSLLRPTYAFSAGMYSTATSNYEAINNENLMGWNSHDGRTILYTADTAQFGDYWWATVDKYRLPGITVTSRSPANIDSPQVGSMQLTNSSGNTTDALASWSGSLAHTPGWQFATGTLDGDATRAVRLFDTIESLSYHISGLTSFNATVYVRDSKPLTGRVALYSSPDNKNWTQPLGLTLSSPATIGGGWSRVQVTPASSLAAGTNYIRLEFLMNDSLPARASDRNWVGGAALADVYGSTPIYGAVGMDLHPPGETLTAKKSWFLFDDEIVALGAGIRASEGVPIESIVENRKLNSAGNNALTVNGTAKSPTLGWSETMAGVNWAHLEGNVAGSGVGYYFPTPATLQGLRSAQSGSLLDMAHTSTTPSTVFTRNFLTMWFDHGIDPGTTSGVGSYGYVLLPGKSSAQTSAYASAPQITVLENSDDAQGVRENGLKLTAVNFWKDQIRQTGIIRANRPVSIMIREKAGQELDVALADPTQDNSGTVDIEINQAGTTGYERDDQIFVYQTAPTIRFTARMDGMSGQTLKARFNLSGTPWSVPPPVVTTAVPVVNFVDDLNGWSKTSAHTADLSFDTATGPNMENDPSRARRTTDSVQSITWQIDGALTLGFRLYYRNGYTGKVAAYRSDNGTTWTALTLAADTPVATAGGWYRVNLATSTRMPFSTRFVRIDLANDSLIYSPQLAQVSISRATIPTMATDPLDDFTKVISQTAGWQFDSSNQTAFEGDLSRLKRTTDTTQTITYYQPNLLSFTARTYYFGTVDGKVSAQTSPDGSTWSNLALARDASVATASNWYRTNFVPAAPLPLGTNYMRLALSTDTRIYTPQLGQVTMELGEFTDPLANWGYVLERTSNWAFDTSNPGFFENDVTRIKRTSDTAESIVYAYPDAISLAITAYAIDTFANKIAVYRSPDGTNWTAVAAAISPPVATGGGWLKATISPTTALPVGTNYVKVELANDTRVYTPQIATVTLRRE